MRYLCMGLLVWLPLSVAWSDELEQAQQLINYFGSTCPSQGEWTKTAAAQASALVEVLRSVRDDPDCQSLAGAVSQLQLLNQKIIRFENDTNRKLTMALNRKQEELLLQLSGSSDPLEQEIIEAELRYVQVNLAELQGAEDFYKNYAKTEESEALQNLVLSTDILLNQALANQSCLIKYPGILSGFAAVGSSVWASLASSGTSLAVSAGVELLGSVIEWVRRSRIQRSISKIARPVVQSSYLCVLESLSNQWCSAEEALNVIHLKASALKSTSPMTEGISLLNYELPVFMGWLNSVRAGAEPNTKGEAERQKEALEREQAMRSARIVALGIINENQILYENAANDELRWSVIKSTVKDILSASGASGSYDPYSGSTIASPLGDIYSPGYGPFYTVGITETEYQKLTSDNFSFNFDSLSADTWPASSAVSFPPSLQLVKSRFLAWVETAEQKIAEEKDLVIQPDPLSVITDALIPKLTGSGRRGLSPYESAQRIFDFLAGEASASMISAQRRLYEDSQWRIESILYYLDGVEDLPQEMSEADLQAELLGILNHIYGLASLEYGASFLENRIQSAIRFALIQMISSEGYGENASLAAQLLAANDIVAELTRYSFTSNLTQIRSDIENSQRITESVIQNFAEVFKDNLRDLVEDLRAKALEEQRRGVWGKYKNGFGQVCLSLMAVPEWIAGKGWGKTLRPERCLGAQVSSLFPKAASSDFIDENSFKLPLEERACMLRSFYRSQRIYQDANAY